MYSAFGSCILHYPLLLPSHSHWTSFFQHVAHLLWVCVCPTELRWLSWTGSGLVTGAWQSVSGDTAGKDGFLSLVTVTLMEGGTSQAPRPLIIDLLKGLISCRYYGGNHGYCNFSHAVVVPYLGDGILQHTSLFPGFTLFSSFFYDVLRALEGWCICPTWG